jgi:hypothetical protein
MGIYGMLGSPTIVATVANSTSINIANTATNNAVLQRQHHILHYIHPLMVKEHKI